MAPRPVAGAAGGRVAVLHAAIRIGHAAAAIQRQQFQPGALGIVASAGVDMAAAAVLQKVGGQFGDDDRHLVDPRRRQPDATRKIAYQPTGLGNLAGFGDGGEHPQVQRASVTTVPCPGVDVMSNSLHSRLAPLRPRPRPPPVV